MKNGKAPTLRKKKMIRSHGMDPAEWLVTRDTTELIELVNRRSLRSLGRMKMRIIMKGEGG